MVTSLTYVFFGFACYKYYQANKGSSQNDYKLISIFLILSIIVRLIYLSMRLNDNELITLDRKRGIFQ